MAKWNPKDNASNWWYLAGASGIGSLVAIIYVLASESRKKLFALLYLVGIVGSLIVYLIFRNDDHKLANLSKKLLIGSLICIVVVVIIMIVASSLYYTAIYYANQGSMGP